MSIEDEKMQLRFTDEQWEEIEIQAAAYGVDVSEYLRILLKDGIEDLKAAQGTARTVH